MIANDTNLAAIMVGMSGAECLMENDRLFQRFDRPRVKFMIFCRAIPAD